MKRARDTQQKRMRTIPSWRDTWTRSKVSPTRRKTGTTEGLSDGGESRGGDTGPAGDVARAEAWSGAFPSILPSVRPDGLTQQKPDDQEPWTVDQRATGERALPLETAVQQKIVLLEGLSPGSHGPLRNPTKVQRGLVCLDFLRKAATVSRLGVGKTELICRSIFSGD